MRGRGDLVILFIVKKHLLQIISRKGKNCENNALKAVQIFVIPRDYTLDRAT